MFSKIVKSSAILLFAATTLSAANFNAGAEKIE